MIFDLWNMFSYFHMNMLKDGRPTSTCFCSFVHILCWNTCTCMHIDCQSFYSSLCGQVNVQPSEWHRARLLSQAWRGFRRRANHAILQVCVCACRMNTACLSVYLYWVSWSIYGHGCRMNAVVLRSWLLYRYGGCVYVVAVWSWLLWSLGSSGRAGDAAKARQGESRGAAVQTALCLALVRTHIDTDTHTHLSLNMPFYSTIIQPIFQHCTFHWSL